MYIKRLLKFLMYTHVQYLRVSKFVSTSRGNEEKKNENTINLFVAAYRGKAENVTVLYIITVVNQKSFTSVRIASRKH